MFSHLEFLKLTELALKYIIRCVDVSSGWGIRVKFWFTVIASSTILVCSRYLWSKDDSGLYCLPLYKGAVAPASSNSFTIPSCPFSTARDSGVRPSMSFASTPIRHVASSSCTTAAEPLLTACDKTVWPELSIDLASAPRLSSSLIIFSILCRVADAEDSGWTAG